MYKKIKSLLIILGMLGFSNSIMAESKRTFTEDEFISVFSGKPKARVVKYLGEPDKQEIAIKPKGASSVLGRPTTDKSRPGKKDKVEMWYYSSLVEYSPKKLYKRVELTLINDRVVNIAFFNQ